MPSRDVPDILSPPNLRRIVGNVESTGHLFCRLELDQADAGSAGLPWRVEITDPAFLDATAGPDLRVLAWIDPTTLIVCRAQVLRGHPSVRAYRQHLAAGGPWHHAPAVPPPATDIGDEPTRPGKEVPHVA